MEKALNELSASTLRRLLLEDIRKFIDSLDNGSTEELEARKQRLREISKLLKEKEHHEIPITWGKNSKKEPPERLKGAHSTDTAPPLIWSSESTGIKEQTR